jgi:D-galacturonate reductase
MVGVNGGKFPAIRKHLDENIGAVFKDMDLSLGIPHARFISLLKHVCFPDLTAFQKKEMLTRRLVRSSVCSNLASSDYTLPDKAAIDKLSPGDAVIIFTPDSLCEPLFRHSV